MVIDIHHSYSSSAGDAVKGFSLKPAPGVVVILCWGHEYCLFSPAPKGEEARKVTKQKQEPVDSGVIKKSAVELQCPLYYRIDSMRDVDLNTALTSMHMIYRALKAYFDNGGDYCYVVNQNDQVRAVGCLPAASLIVEAGTLADVRAHTDRSIFVMLDSNIIDEVDLPIEGRSNSRSPGSEPYAYYGPWLKADWTAEVVPPSAAVAGFYCQAKRNHKVLESPLVLDLRGGLAPLFGSSDYHSADRSNHGVVCIIREANTSPILGETVFDHDCKKLSRDALIRLWSAFTSICRRSWIRRGSAPIPLCATSRFPITCTINKVSPRKA